MRNVSARCAQAFLVLAVVITQITAVTAASALAAPIKATAWVPLSPATSPPERVDASMAFDLAIGEIVLFGGSSTGNDEDALDDTWTYDGSTWTRQSPTVSPPARAGASMAYDASTSQMVLFGGEGQDFATLADTWTYNGSTWTEQTPAMSPPARRHASMTYDTAIHEIVLFGGSSTNSGTPLADTWTYNGINWTKQVPPTSPPAREGAAMAYDPASGTVDMFGGDMDNSPDLICDAEIYDDAWTYDGVTWTEQNLSTIPTPRAYASMAFDPATGDMVLFGGIYETTPCEPGGYNHYTVYDDTWIFDGTSWSDETPDVSPPARSLASMVFEPSTGDMMLFGGESEISPSLADTWSYGPVGSGYWLAAADGGVFSFDAHFYGSTGSVHLNQPVVGMASAPNRQGYWLVAKDGGVFSFGPGAHFEGSAVKMHLNESVIGIAADPVTIGYWLVATDGDVISFGAPSYGDAAKIHLNQPVVGVAATADGSGYWLVAKDGGVFGFGPGGHFEGSASSLHLNRPVVGIAADPVTGGYWLVAADGGVFSFDAPFYGSTARIHLNQPVVGITAAPNGKGYWLVAKDGGVFSFGPGAVFHGSAGNIHLNQPVVAMTGQ